MTRPDGLRFFGMLCVSALLAASVVVAISWRTDQLRMQRFENVTTLMLGSSLTRYASPDPQGGPILSDAAGGAFLRLAYSRASEGMLLNLAGTAARAGVENIVIEVNPIVARFADQPGDCFAPRHWLEALEATRLAGQRVLRGHNVFGSGLIEPPPHPGPSRIDANLARLYPLQVIGPCRGDAWYDLVAAYPDTRISFVAMPRRGIARDRIGTEVMALFDATAAAFAGDLGAALFVADPAGDWGDENFADQAHLSVVGAERFQRSFVAWHRALQ
jgi:hypothetical protein